MKKLILSILTLLVVVNCSHKNIADEEKVQVAPFRIKESEEVNLNNGLKVIFIDDQTLPRVGLNLMVKAGSYSDPTNLEGITNMTGDLLDQGSSKHSANQISDMFAQMGSEFSSRTSQDYTALSTDGLVENANKLLDLFYECVTMPKFANAEIGRRKSETGAELLQIKDNPASYAELLLQQNAYTDSRYAHSSLGTQQSLQMIKRVDIQRQYAQYFTPANSILAVTGQLNAKLKKDVIAQFSKWQKKSVTPLASENVYNAPDANVLVYAKKGLEQTQIRFFHKGVARSNPDYIQLRLANTILGGAFASRLNQKVRDELGLTYNITSHFETLKNDGIFAIDTFTRNDKVQDTVYNSVKVLKDFVRKGATDQELRSSQSLTIGQYPAALETADKLAFNLMYLDLNNIDKSYLNNFIKDVRTAQIDDLNRVVSKYIKPDDIKIIIYTDYDKTGAQIKDVMSKITAEKLIQKPLQLKVIND